MNQSCGLGLAIQPTQRQQHQISHCNSQPCQAPQDSPPPCSAQWPGCGAPGAEGRHSPCQTALPVSQLRGDIRLQHTSSSRRSRNSWLELGAGCREQRQRLPQQRAWGKLPFDSHRAGAELASRPVSLSNWNVIPTCSRLRIWGQDCSYAEVEESAEDEQQPRALSLRGRAGSHTRGPWSQNLPTIRLTWGTCSLHSPLP